MFPSIEGTNLAVSGANVRSLIHRRADAQTAAEINSETDLVLFPRLGSQLEIAETLDSPLVICWIGNNDVLSAAISFDRLDASQMASVEDFQADFQEIVQRLLKPGRTLVFANIPDVTNIGFLMDRQDLIKFLGADFGLPEGAYTSIVAMFLIKLGLDDGSIIQDPNFVLDAGEVQRIQERTQIFNQIIQETVTAVEMPVVDINGWFREIAENPPVVFGIPITPRYLGGLFSLDGVHPSNIAHAAIANRFILTINSHFNRNIPLLGLKDLLLTFLFDPFVDKDGDGRVRGRFGAGLLETVSPLLGVSGDKNDLRPDTFQAESAENLRQDFIELFLKSQEKDPASASQFQRKDFLEAFRTLFRLQRFGR